MLIMLLGHVVNVVSIVPTVRFRLLIVLIVHLITSLSVEIVEVVLRVAHLELSKSIRLFVLVIIQSVRPAR